MRWLDQIKECRTCGEEKPMRDYYQHPAMPDGHLNHCKECVKERARRYRADNIERVREYDRNRPNADKRREKHKVRAKERGYTKRQRQESDPIKRRARNMVNNAIRGGKLEAKPCERCGYAVGVCAHHEDYSKPLDVTWLCAPCHGERHREINEERRRSAA